MEKKIYRAIVIGTPKLDSNNNPVKDANGVEVIEFIKKAKLPRAEFKNLAGKPASEFVVVALFEDTKSTSTSADGETMLLANEQRKPLVRAILDNRYPLLYPLLKKALTDPALHSTIIPTQKLVNVLVPGLVDTFETGFEYIVKRRNTDTGVSEVVNIQKTDPVSGKVKTLPMVMNTITEFWYGNEVDMIDTMRANAIKVVAEDAQIRKPEGTMSNRDAEIEAAEAAEQETPVAPVVTPVAPPVVSAAAQAASAQISAGATQQA